MIKQTTKILKNKRYFFNFINDKLYEVGALSFIDFKKANINEDLSLSDFDDILKDVLDIEKKFIEIITDDIIEIKIIKRELKLKDILNILNKLDYEPEQFKYENKLYDIKLTLNNKELIEPLNKKYPKNYHKLNIKTYDFNKPIKFMISPDNELYIGDKNSTEHYEIIYSVLLNENIKTNINIDEFILAKQKNNYIELLKYTLYAINEGWIRGIILNKDHRISLLVHLTKNRLKDLRGLLKQNISLIDDILIDYSDKYIRRDNFTEYDYDTWLMRNKFIKPIQEADYQTLLKTHLPTINRTYKRDKKKLIVEFMGRSEIGLNLFEFRTVSVTTKNKDYWQQKVRFLDYENIFVNRLKTYKSSYRRIRTLRKLIWHLIQGDLKMSCNCPAFLYWGFKYINTKGKTLVGKGENRPPDIKNPDKKGHTCKHLRAVLTVLPFLWNDIQVIVKKDLEKKGLYKLIK